MKAKSKKEAVPASIDVTFDRLHTLMVRSTPAVEARVMLMYLAGDVSRYLAALNQGAKGKVLVATELKNMRYRLAEIDEVLKANRVF
jgi:hypothetical protein